MNDAIPRDVPFSLSCCECDTDPPGTYEDAVRDGWTQIEYFPKGYSENYLGLCPGCRQDEEQREELLHKTFASPDAKGGAVCLP